MELPIFSVNLIEGMNSPVDVKTEENMDINSYLVKDRPHTFLVKVMGNAMSRASVYSGDLLFVNCSIKPRSKDLVLAVANREFMLKRFIRKKNRVFLEKHPEDISPIEVTSEPGINIWGVVTHIVHKFRDT
ncbi:MAG: hypothetical protein H7A25_23865 [Leptospiraceae bacterium]|nr:hypothetical protein [Leptospiraceae bacterium]MCP5502959.1 hypothetical protein [Leptospiraceae bacterium]